ncbi:MAG: ABC transporter substrate-binding protein [Desulfomonilaceae bacterium]
MVRFIEFNLAFWVILVFSMGIQESLSTSAWSFQEAPILSQSVRNGKLPPVQDRLPPHPVVVKPFEATGVYGGTWRRAYTGISDLNETRKILYDPLVRWSPDFKIVPNLCESWEIQDQGRIYILKLVHGVKWSDGAPFTADDVIFAVNDTLLDKDVSSSAPGWIAPGGDKPKVSKIDDFTVRFEFKDPYGLFLENLATPNGMALVTRPKHYLVKFHKKYAKPDELDELLRIRRMSSWNKLFNELINIQQGLFVTTELPSILAWTTKVPAPCMRFIMERNPYYWKVDEMGNQLPYIDRLATELLTEANMVILKAVAGDIDMQANHLGGMSNTILLLAQLGTGNFRLIPKISTASVGLLLAPNLNHQDPVLRKIIEDKRFRIAMSHAIRRAEVNDILYRGQGTPRQAAPLKESQFYSEAYEESYLKNDPDLANKMLDDMDLKVGSDGWRQRPDGKRLQLSLDVVASIQTWVDAAEIIASDFKKIKIDTAVKSETRELFRQRTQTCAHDIALWPGDGGMECLLDPRWYFPYSSESLQAPLYAQWYQSRGKNGHKPPSQLLEMMNDFDKIVRTVNKEKQKEFFDRILAANQENLYVIGLVYQPPDYYVVSPRMKNIPPKDFQSWIYPNPGPIHPEQFFFIKKR